MAINLRVTPDVLTSEAGAIMNKINKIENNLQTINEQIRSSKNSLVIQSRDAALLSKQNRKTRLCHKSFPAI